MNPRIPYIINNIIVVFTRTYYFDNVLPVYNNRKKEYIAMLILFMTHTLFTACFLPMPGTSKDIPGLRFAFESISIIIILLIIKRNKFLSTLFSYMIYLVFTISAEIMSMGCAMIIYKLIGIETIKNINTTIVTYAFYDIITLLLYQIVFYWYKNGYSNYLKVDYYFIALLIIFSQFLWLYFLPFYSIYNRHYNTRIFYLLLALSMFCYLTILLLIIRIYRNQKRMIKLETNKQFNEELDKRFNLLLQKQKILNDIYNEMKNIDISNGNSTIEIKKEVDEIISDITEYSNIPVLNAIISYYKKACESNNIIFKYDISKNISKNIDQYDLNTILTNIIRNSIEATLVTNNPYIELSVNQIDNKLFIECINSYEKDSYKINSKKISGNGINIVKKTIAKYDGLFNITEENNIYHVEIIININS